MLNDSDIVEHAPYKPIKGILSSLAAKLDDVIWFNKSPANK